MITFSIIVGVVISFLALSMALKGSIHTLYFEEKTMKKTRYQHDGVTRKPYKVEQLPAGKLEYRKIQAFEACNYFGDNAMWEKGTPEGDRHLIEKRFIPNDPTEKIRFSNCW